MQPRRVLGAPDVGQGLPGEVPSPVHIGAPRFPGLVEPVVGGVRAEDEQEGQHGGREGERNRGHFELLDRIREAANGHQMVEHGHKHRDQSAQDHRRTGPENHARRHDAQDVAAMSPRRFVLRPFFVPVDGFAPVHTCVKAAREDVEVTFKSLYISKSEASLIHINSLLVSYLSPIFANLK